MNNCTLTGMARTRHQIQTRHRLRCVQPTLNSQETNFQHTELRRFGIGKLVGRNLGITDVMTFEERSGRANVPARNWELFPNRKSFL